MFFWIYDYPTLYGGALFAFVFVVVTCVGILVFRRFGRDWVHSDPRANEMVGIALSSLSVLYGLLLGLLAVAAYQNYSAVNDLITKEAASVGALYVDIGGYPQPIRSRLQGRLRDYTRYVIDESWPEQRRGIVPSDGDHRVTSFVNDLMTFEPSEKRSEAILHAEALRQFNILVGFRRSRLSSVTQGLPAIMWWVVAIGAALSILLIVIFDMEVHVHLLLGGALACFLGIMIFLVAAMDYPLRGEFSVGPDAFELVYNTLIKPVDTVNRSMAALMAKATTLGPPRLEGTDSVAGHTVPALYFGATRMNNTFDVVDAVAKEFGGTATFFVKAGDAYVRVATNVKNDDGSRALGTKLDPVGPAIEMISRGRSYYGEATILGKPYVTGYEPITDASGTIIGIYYAGYRK